MNISRPPHVTKPRHPKVAIGIVVLVLGVASLTVVYLMITHNKTPANITSNTSTFAFDGAQLPGWESGGTNHITADERAQYKGTESLPEADTIIHLKDVTDPSNCFVYLDYMTDKKDPAAKINDFAKQSTGSDSDLTYREVGTPQITMQTSEGDKKFVLHQYAIEGDPKTSMLRATEYGFFSVGDGYMDIRGNCTSTDQLSTTIPVLTAVSFKL